MVVSKSRFSVPRPSTHAFRCNTHHVVLIAVEVMVVLVLVMESGVFVVVVVLVRMMAEVIAIDQATSSGNRFTGASRMEVPPIVAAK